MRQFQIANWIVTYDEGSGLVINTRPFDTRKVQSESCLDELAMALIKGWRPEESWPVKMQSVVAYNDQPNLGCLRTLVGKTFVPDLEAQ